MSKAMKTMKLQPLHETVPMALVQAVVGIQADQRKQGEMLGLLGLIGKTEIPEKAIPGIVIICARVRDGIDIEGAKSRPGMNRQFLGDLVELADNVVTNLKLRVKQKAKEAAASGGKKK